MIEAIATAVRATPGASLLDVDPGRSTNRTVYTFVGDPEALFQRALGMRIDLLGWRGSTGDIPPMAGLYWRIYYQIENPRIGDLQWRSSTGDPLMAGYRICEG